MALWGDWLVKLGTGRVSDSAQRSDDLVSLSRRLDHAFQSSVRQGFRWWEIDTTYYILRALSWLGLVWNLKTPPGHVLRNEHRLGVRIIHRAAEQLAARFNPERVAFSIASALQGPELSSLQDVLRRAHEPGKDNRVVSVDFVLSA